MTPQQAKAFLRAHTGQRVRVTFSDGEVQSVDIHTVDDEGFVHSGPDGDNELFWTFFSGVTDLSTQI